MKSRRSMRPWAVPAGAVIAIAAIAAVPQLVPAGADPVPNLPQLTPAQLLAKVRSADVRTFSGDVSMTANLGLPDLGSLGSFGPSGSGSLLDYLAGTHTAKVWADGPEHLRLAVPTTGAESDWIRNGTDVWAWNSRDQSVTHAALPADAASPERSTSLPADAPLTPDQLAQEILAKVDPSTNVSVETPGYVAGRPVYELVLAPKAATSTIDRVTVSVDAATGAPLSTAITAKGETSPAFEVGFTAISFNQPDASVFSFAPPAGATVTQADSPGAFLGLGGRPGATDEPRHIPKDGSTTAVAPPDGTGSTTGNTIADPAGATTRTEVVGTDWTSVAIVKGVPTNGIVRSVLDNAQAVSGPAGSGRLVTTPLVNVLVLDDGRVVVGAVTPDALQAAVAP